jgi:hypothetical protein
VLLLFPKGMGATSKRCMDRMVEETRRPAIPVAREADLFESLTSQTPRWVKIDMPRLSRKRVGPLV